MRTCPAYALLLLTVMALSLSSMLSGCGKTGDLYLPDEDTPENTESRG